MDQYRETCSEVVPKAVYISGHKVPSDRACLRKHQITHIVNMAADVCDNSFPGDFNYLTYYLAEPPRIWQALNFWWLDVAEPPRDCRADVEGLIGVRESLDGEFKILQQCTAAASSECERGAELSFV